MRLKSILFFLFAISIQTVLAYKKGDVLHVFAKSGLNMRASTGTSGKKLLKIPFGSDVTIVTDNTPTVSFSVTELKGYKISGVWVKVDYKGQKGYVFDGYLSSMPLPKTTTTLIGYLDANYNKNGGQKEIKRYQDGNEICAYKQLYKAGIVYSTTGCGEGGNGQDITFDFSSQRELYLVCLALLDDDYNVWSYDVSEKAIKFEPKDSGAGCYYSIYMNNGKLTIDNYCGC